ncbi:MAG: DUF488 domain-containing protein [Burkholderiales bacterium]
MFTIGHSTRPLAEFSPTLTAQAVSTLIDVRTVPRSLHNPQFNGDALPESLAPAGIAYALIVHDVRADEIVSPSRLQGHRLTPFAHVDGLRITYPPYDDATLAS